MGSTTLQTTARIASDPSLAGLPSPPIAPVTSAAARSVASAKAKEESKGRAKASDESAPARSDTGRNARLQSMPPVPTLVPPALAPAVAISPAPRLSVPFVVSPPADVHASVALLSVEPVYGHTSTRGGGIDVAVDISIDPIPRSAPPKTRVTRQRLEAVFRDSFRSGEAHKVIIPKGHYRDDPAINPLAHVHECSGCCLSREEDPKKRAFAEDAMATAVAKLDLPKDARLNYTAVGSGYLFQDVVMIERLIALGHTNIHVSLIDIDYAEIVQALQSSAGAMLQPSSYYDEAHLVRKSKSATSMNNSLYDVARWFDADKSGASVTISIYKSAADYVADCRHNAARKPHVLAGVDLDCQGAVDAFRSVEDGTLRQQGVSVMLSRLRPDGKVEEVLTTVASPAKSAGGRSSITYDMSPIEPAIVKTT